MKLKLKIPNLRKMFVPDPGMVIGDADLDRADAQVVAWDAGAVRLKEIFKEHYRLVLAGKDGIDLHAENAKEIRCTRHQAKAGVHATNYGVRPPTLARTLGVTVREAENFQARWFGANPEIARWHNRIRTSLLVNRTITNAFGYSAQFFDRPENSFTEALAWIPQSTVALTINKAWANINANLPDVEVLLQVHDSLVFQYACDKDPDIRPLIRKEMLVTIPYDDPLIIPVGLKLSMKSWGDVKEASWNI